MKVKVYDINGQTTEELNLNFDKLLEKVNYESIKQYIRVYLSNQRQGTSKVKNKSEVRGGGKKPWKQKHTGRARAGSSRSPLWVGGGIVHGPTPKDWSLSLNKKLILNSFKSALMLLAEKDKIGSVNVVTDFDKKISTKSASNLLNKVELTDKKVLLINKSSVNTVKSFRNIKNVTVKDISNVNTHDLVNTQYVLIEKSAIDSLTEKVK